MNLKTLCQISFLLVAALWLCYLPENCWALEKGLCPRDREFELHDVNKKAGTKLIWDNPNSIRVFFPLPSSHCEIMNEKAFIKYSQQLTNKDLITAWIRIPREEALAVPGEVGKDHTKSDAYKNCPPSYMAMLSRKSDEAKSILFPLGFKRVVTYGTGCGQWQRYIVIDDTKGN